MKLLLVILGFCALTASVLSRTIKSEELVALEPFEDVETIDINFLDLELTGQNYDFVDSLKEVFSELQRVRVHVKEILIALVEKVHQWYEDIELHLIELTEEIQKNLQELEKLGDSIKECLKKYLPDVKKVKEEAAKDLKKCAKNATKGAEGVKKQLEKQLRRVKELLLNVKNEVADCLALKNPRKIAECLRNKSGQLTGQIKEAINETISASRKAAKDLQEIGKQLISCKKSVKSNALDALGKIAQKIKKCTQQGGED